MATLTNLGTSTDDFDLPAAGPAVKIFPAFQPGDSAYDYRGEIDVSVIGSEPRSLERLRTQYPYLYQGGNLGTGFTIVNSGTESTPANVTMENGSSYSGTEIITFPGVASNYLTVPDAANLDLTTGVEITFRAAIMEPDNRLGNQRIVAKSGSFRAYEVWVGYDSVHCTLGFTRDGSQTATSAQKLPCLPEHFYWFRVTYNSATSTTKFYVAPDTGSSTEPSSWTDLGTLGTNSGAMVANTDTLKIGTYNGTGDMFKGHLANLIIRNAATAGTTVLNIDVATDCAAMTTDSTTTFTATSGQTVTLNKSGFPPNGTVRVPHVYGWTLADGSRYGPGVNFDELLSDPNQLQLIWVRATVGSYSTTRKRIFPILRAYSTGKLPYGDNAWGMYFDTFQGTVNFAYRLSGNDSFRELLVPDAGTVVGTGDQIFGVALLETNGVTHAWNFRYNPSTGAFVYPVFGGTAALQTSITGTDLINSTTNNLEMWAGVAGFSMTSVGIANFPSFTTDANLVAWSDNGDILIRDFIEHQLQVVALGQTPSYDVGEYWRASASGTAEMASSEVDVGDILAVKSTAPTTWQQIKLSHPSRRKSLFRPAYTTFGYPADPLTVTDPEDLFFWAVVSPSFLPDTTTEYVAYGYDSSGGAYLDMEFYHNSVEGWNVYMELDDDDGNAGWGNINQLEGLPAVFQHGHSSPTLIAQALDKANNRWRGWIYDPAFGVYTFETQETDPVSFNTSTFTMDSFTFFGPDVGEGYNDAIYWGGGWRQGTGAIPTEDGLIELWERTVYGYPLG